jgi:hypothetical protein
MASGDTLLVFTPAAGVAPSSNYATFDTRNGHLVLDFDASTDEAVSFRGVLPRNYAGGGLTATVIWMATSATSGSVRWQGAIERGDTGTDFDADSFATAQSAGGTASGTSGQPTYTALTFSSGANMDSLAVGEAFRFKLNRDADGTSGTDDATGDAELIAIEIKET